MAPEVPTGTPGASPEPPLPELPRLFHQLNNQLGVILANAELLEIKLTDETHRARAGQVVASALAAITTVQDIRRRTGAIDLPATRPSVR